MIALSVLCAGLAGVLFLMARRLHEARARVDTLESRLASVLSRGAIALSIWSPDGRLTACNEKFREFYPDTPVGSAVNLEDLLRFTATRGLVQVAEDQVDAWVAARLAATREPGRDVVRTADGRWLAIDIGPTDRDETMMLYVDVTGEHAPATAAADLTTRVEVRTREVEVLRRAVDLAMAADTTESAASELVRLVCEWTGWAVGLAYRVDLPTGQVMQISGSLQVTGESWAPVAAALETSAQQTPEHLVRRVLQSGRVTWVAHLDGDPTYSAERRTLMPGLQGACGVPVVRRDRVVAVLEFLSAEPLAPSPARTAVLESLAGLLALAGSADR